MSHTRLQRLRTIRAGYDATPHALDLAVERWNDLQEYFLLRQQNVAALRLARKRLEDTYIVRLFSEFEAILREYCQEIGIVAPYKTESLLNRVAARRSIIAAVRDEAHEVRERRNTIVHGNNAAHEIAFTRALSRLSRFLAWLPEP